MEDFYSVWDKQSANMVAEFDEYDKLMAFLASVPECDRDYYLVERTHIVASSKKDFEDLLKDFTLGDPVTEDMPTPRLEEK